MRAILIVFFPAVLILIFLFLVLDPAVLEFLVELLLAIDGRVGQLGQDVLDLPLELLVRVLHDIVQHVRHTQLIR